MYPVTGPRKIKVKKMKRNERQASMMYKSIVNNPKVVSHTVRLVCLSILLMTHCVNQEYQILDVVTKMLQTVAMTDDDIVNVDIQNHHHALQHSCLDQSCILQKLLHHSNLLAKQGNEQ